MDKVLHLPEGGPAAVGNLLRGLQAGPQAKYDLSTANALWLQQGMTFRPEFLDAATKHYDSAMHRWTSPKPSKPGR